MTRKTLNSKLKILLYCEKNDKFVKHTKTDYGTKFIFVDNPSEASNYRYAWFLKNIVKKEAEKQLKKELKFRKFIFAGGIFTSKLRSKIRKAK